MDDSLLPLDNSSDLDFLEMNSIIEKTDTDDTSLDKINAIYQPNETDTYIDEFLKKTIDENKDLQMLLERPPSVSLSLPDIPVDLDDINIDEPVQDNNVFPTEICGTGDISSTTEPQVECTNEFEAVKEFLTFKTPRPPKVPNQSVQENNLLPNKTSALPNKTIYGNKHMLSKSIQGNNKLANKNIHINNKLSAKNLQASNVLPKISMQVINKLPYKGLQPTNKFIIKDKIKENKFHKEVQHIKKSSQKQNVIQDFVHISDRIVPPRAVAVLPPGLQIRNETILASRLLPPRLRFGPVQGIKRMISKSEFRDKVADSAAMKNPVFFMSGKRGEVNLIDTSDKDKANWLCLLPVGTYETANVWLYEDNNELYGFTTKYIQAKTPLTLGYSKAYADKYRLPTFQPILNLTAYASLAKKWSCRECNRTFSTAALMQRHFDFYHKNEKPEPWRRYCCKQCSLQFGKCNTFKRHMETCGDKAQVKPEIVTEPTEKPIEEPKQESRIPTPVLEEIEQNEQFEEYEEEYEEYDFLSDEDEQIPSPSDEALENFANSLDLSSVLFDAERMSDFEQSNSSRPESALRHYDIREKDENSLLNDVEFMKFSEDLISNDVDAIDKSKRKVVSCVYCKQNVLVNKRRQHVYKCKSRRKECKCGKVFINIKRFIQHIFREHRKDIDIKVEHKPEKLSPEFKKYECELCRITFKRRGMLVNHMWRVHKAKTAAAPMERRVKHYLCVACPKIYRTAAKRNRHVRTHHPGEEKMRAQCIEGGVVMCKPAACSACPRQYATRAKLLEHVRKLHPHLAPPSKKKSKTNLRIAN